MTTATVDIVKEALARGMVYQALAHAFHYPTAGRRREPLPGVRDALAVLGAPAEVLDALAAAEAHLSSRTSRRLAAEHVALFSHGREGQALPYESDFTSVSVFNKSQEMADVAGFYRAFGLTWEGGRERPDHLSLEAEFAYFLALKEAHAASQGDDGNAALCRDALRSFLGDHLARWLPPFARALAAEAPDSPYSAVARFADAFVRADCRSLAVTPRPLPARPVAPAPEGDLDCNGCPLSGDGEAGP